MEENQNKSFAEDEWETETEQKEDRFPSGREATQQGKPKRKSVHKRLQQTPSFALTEEEQEAAAAAEIAPSEAAAEPDDTQTPAKKSGKKKRMINRPSPFALNADDFAQDDGEEDIDAQLQFQETEAHIELPMDHELEEEAKQSSEPKPQQKKKRRHWYGVPMGMLVLCLALVGLIFIGTQAYHYIYARVTDDSAERAYDTYLTPVVMLDPEPFESIDAANKEMVLQAAVWKTVFENATTTTDYDENARMVFSGELVRSNAVKLFGVNCILTPTDIYLPGSGKEEGTPEATISYDEATDTYHVPLIGNVGTYQPYTVSARNKGDVSTLRVAYCVAADNVVSTMPTVSQAAESTTTPEDEVIKTKNGNLRVIKYVEYEITYDEDTQLQYVSAVRSLEKS